VGGLQCPSNAIKDFKEKKMTVEVILGVLGWSTVINYAVLILWFLLFSLAHDWIYRVHGKWFTLKAETFDAIHYAGMAFFKLCIFLFLLVPYLSLRIVS
jgi:hypothetical protein